MSGQAASSIGLARAPGLRVGAPLLAAEIRTGERLACAGPGPVVGAGCASDALMLTAEMLAGLMPMFLWLGPDGTIRGAGPTLAKIIGPGVSAGDDFFSLFQIRRPRGIEDMASLQAHAGARLNLCLTGGARTAFRGLAVPVACGAGLLINLSFGISVARAVRDHALTDTDFAPTDLTVELLYLAEAKAVVMDELHALNLRLQEAKSHAEAEALTDPLTGLANRRAFDQALAALIDGGSAFGLVHLDLDYFKQVNDTLGHAAGDHVLRRVAQLLRAETRAGDTIARVGGDEFVLLFPGVAEPARIEAIAARIVAGISQPFDYRGSPARVGASIGMTLSDFYSRPQAARMLADADAALYASKAEGRGRATLWSPGAGEVGAGRD